MLRKPATQGKVNYVFGSLFGQGLRSKSTQTYTMLSGIIHLIGPFAPKFPETNQVFTSKTHGKCKLHTRSFPRKHNQLSTRSLGCTLPQRT
eukprot:g45176.t1